MIGAAKEGKGVLQDVPGRPQRFTVSTSGQFFESGVWHEAGSVLRLRETWLVSGACHPQRGGRDRSQILRREGGSGVGRGK